MATHATNAAAPVADDYLALVLRFPLKHIRDDDHLAAAHVLIDELSIIGEDDLTPGQMDYLLALGDLTTIYENDDLNDLTDQVSGRDMLEHMAEEHELSAEDVGRLVGRPADGAGLLDGSLPITAEDAGAVARRFHLPADLFMKQAKV